jgi:hypothetical protein
MRISEEQCLIGLKPFKAAAGSRDSRGRFRESEGECECEGDKCKVRERGGVGRTVGRRASTATPARAIDLLPHIGGF